MIERIVVGAEGSPGGRSAIEWAAELARGHGARLIIVHAFQPLDHLPELTPGADFATLEERALVDIREDWCRPCADAEVPFEAIVREGEPARVLLDVAEAEAADVIVVGSRRLGSVKRLVLGSTSSKVVHESTRPVLVVPAPTA